jgi:hypothetical protein
MNSVAYAQIVSASIFITIVFQYHLDSVLKERNDLSYCTFENRAPAQWMIRGNNIFIEGSACLLNELQFEVAQSSLRVVDHLDIGKTLVSASTITGRMLGPGRVHADHRCTRNLTNGPY